MKETYVPCEFDGGVARQSCILREGHEGDCVYKTDPSGRLTQMSNTELIRRLRQLAANHAAVPKEVGYAAIFEEAADALTDADLEQQRSRKLGEEIVSLAQTVKRILTA